MRRLIIAAAAVASVMAPAVASQAQDYGRHRGGYDRDHRYERYDDRRDGYDRDRRGRGHDRWDRGRRDWWRGRDEFRGYNGRRNGYYFAPGYGYYRADPRYYNHRWNRGSYLPQSYRRYYVQDPYFYGLRPAPYGYRWVYVDNDLVLVSIATGLILDVLLDVY
ncbi:MAG: RcnB family protein [Caulobacteraceae bacterium]|nr:RcnB family protein [Caulobacteraceae bacterium]